MFTKELIQAISDWQRGGSQIQKRRRGQVLKQQAAKLPGKYKTPTRCFRQIALKNEGLQHLGTQYQLPETISAWTKSENVARDFKGGVPQPGEYLAVIFSLTPKREDIIVDIDALFTEPDFVQAVEQHSKKIDGFGFGMGRYGNSQYEVVIEMDRVPLNTLYAWGGYSSSLESLAGKLIGHAPNEGELNVIKNLMEHLGIKPGAYWLTTPEALARMEQRLIFQALLRAARR